MARGKHALKPKLGAGSRPNKSLIFVWSVLISHTVPPDINPGLAREGMHTDSHKQSGMDKERENVFNDEM